MTVILSSHLLDLVQSICDRVALFSNGKIGVMGKVTDLMRDVLGTTTVIQLDASGGFDTAKLDGIAGLESITKLAEGSWRIDASRDVRGEVARRVIEAGANLERLSLGMATLQDVYTKFFEGKRHAA